MKTFIHFFKVCKRDANLILLNQVIRQLWTLAGFIREDDYDKMHVKIDYFSVC